MESPALVQDRHTLNLDELQMQVFHELQGKLKEILLAIKALEKAQWKGQGGQAEIVSLKKFGKGSFTSSS